MKKNHAHSRLTSWGLVLFVLTLMFSCQTDNTKLTPTENALVKDSVSQLVANIATHISAKGPREWLSYFENSTDFFMSSDGQLAFQDYAAAKGFIENSLVKTISQITLRQSHLRIDPLTIHFASFGFDFHEDITDTSGKTLPVDGYVTGVAEQTQQGWKLRNLHWSILKTN